MIENTMQELLDSADVFDGYQDTQRIKNIIRQALQLIESQKQEIAFLKAMQLQMSGNLSEEVLGQLVSNVLPR